MRVYTHWIKDCLVIEEGNAKLTLFHYDIPVAHVVSGVCFCLKSCLTEGAYHAEVFTKFKAFLVKRTMFRQCNGDDGVIVECENLHQRLTITIGN